jgi:hypothetical protein
VRIVVSAVVALTALVLAGPSLAGRITLEDVVPARSASTVAVTVRGAASFTVELRAPKQGRARLFLLGRTAPGGGPLIDTATAGCAARGTAVVCRGAYEPLPRGSYTFRIVRLSGPAGRVTLSVRW